MRNSQWLTALLQTSFDEIYVIDGQTSRILHASESACANLQRPFDELRGLPFAALAAPSAETQLERRLRSLGAHGKAEHHEPSGFSAVLVRKNGTAYPILLRMQRCNVNRIPVIIVSGQPQVSRKKSGMETEMGHNPFKTADIPPDLNAPWLVYKIIRKNDGSVFFPWLSGGCENLLGIMPAQLRANPDLFLSFILPQDRDSYMESMTESAIDMKSWNWEGRIWVDAVKEIRWINLLAAPHPLENGDVQWEGIMTNITRSKQEEMEIRLSRTRLAELSAHVEEVKEHERTQISREIHDDLGGNLTAIKMALALLAKRLPRNKPELAEKAQYVDQLVDRTIEAAHRIASNMRPSILDIGIVAALEWQADEFARQSGIPCRFESAVSEIQLQSAQSTALFRIAQEALTNIARHAEASQVSIQLTTTRTHVQLRITDNGKGITVADRMKPQSFGIRGMIERAHSLGGKLSFDSVPGKRNTITVVIPYTDMFFDSEISLPVRN
ncbi:MAG: histidine kinase, partial [Burkholderiaceae bacterium]|jgi:signal transduction histidine kinase|nr:histidine kinase [Burkholderiaceae bacterium]